MARRSPSNRFTYGLKKASILAALINALFLLVAVGAITSELIDRLILSSKTDPGVMMWVGAVAIVMNGATALLFSRGRTTDINVRAAFQHMAADAAVSAGVVVAGALILGDWSAMDRSGRKPARRGRGLVGQHRPSQGSARHVADGCSCRNSARGR